MKVAVIGGTGLASLGSESQPATNSAKTPYGSASALPRRFVGFPDAVFLNRHGDGHLSRGRGGAPVAEAKAMLPHEINYRANLWLLRELGVEAVVAVLAVGAIASGHRDGDMVLPRQIIDYTWGRAHSFHGSTGAPAQGSEVRFADFSEPFDPAPRQMLAVAAERVGAAVHDGGVYGCTQGPRFETAAEIDRMERDGCTLVGMTAMPEAALARELGLPYAGICLVVNPAAGRGPATIEVADLLAVVDDAQPRLLRLLAEFLQLVDQP